MLILLIFYARNKLFHINTRERTADKRSERKSRSTTEASPRRKRGGQGDAAEKAVEGTLNC